MTKKTLYMETTEIPAEKTAGEIIAALVTAGATQINTEYQLGKITGLRWIMRVAGHDALFAMPARVAPIYKILEKRARSAGRHMDNDEQRRLAEKSQRIAWRQLLRWVQAQLAMIDCGMAEAAEVFFPYLQTPAGKSVFDVFKAHGLKALSAAGDRPQ